MKTHWSQKRLLTPLTADIMFLEIWDLQIDKIDISLFLSLFWLSQIASKCIRLPEISWSVGYLWWDLGTKSSTFRILSTCFWPNSSRASPNCQAPRQAGPEQGSRASCPHHNTYNQWGQHDDLCCGDHDQYGRDDQQRRWVKINVLNFMIRLKWEKGKGRNEKCKTQVSISSSAGKMWKSEWNACWDWGRCTSSQFFTQTSNLSYEIVFWRFISWKCVSKVFMNY